MESDRYINKDMYDIAYLWAHACYDSDNHIEIIIEHGFREDLVDIRWKYVDWKERQKNEDYYEEI